MNMTPALSSLSTASRKVAPEPGRCAAALLAALLTACGGDGEDAVAVPKDTVRLACDVADATSGNAVSNATVNYQAGITEYTTQTNASDNCELNLPAAEVAGVKFPAASVIKDGYEPQTILCPTLQGAQSCTRDVLLIPLAANVSIPVGGDIVMHLAERGIIVRSPSLRGIAEEAPGAYKDVTEVVEAADRAGLARIVARLEPMVCIKG